MKFGCIADDFTGATDLAGLLRRSALNERLVSAGWDGLRDKEIAFFYS